MLAIYRHLQYLMQAGQYIKWLLYAAASIFLVVCGNALASSSFIMNSWGFLKRHFLERVQLQKDLVTSHVEAKER